MQLALTTIASAVLVALTAAACSGPATPTVVGLQSTSCRISTSSLDPRLLWS